MRQKLLDKHNAKLQQLGIPYQAVLPYTSGSNPKNDYVCDKGHKFNADRARIVAGKTKCPICDRGETTKLTHAQYEERLLEIESTLYPAEPYAGIHTKIKHECIEGHSHAIMPSSVLKGSNCPYCTGMVKKTSESYSQELLDKGIQYTLQEDYVNVMTKVKHQCLACFHVWPVKPHDILHGSGCPDCARMGFSTARPATLYYIRIWDQYHTYYKIGITNKSIAHRMKNVKKNYKVLLEKQYETGREALAAEQMILEEYRDEKIYAPQFLPNGGYTELFKSDILLLDVDLNRLI